MSATQMRKSAAEIEPAPGAAAGRRVPLLQLAERYALLVVMALVILFFAVYSKSSPVYLSSANLQQLVGNQVVVAVVALAALIPLACGFLDLSVGGMTGVSSIACAAAMSKAHAPLVVAILIALLIATSIGLLNGILISKLGLDAIVTTLGMSILLTGIMVLYTQGNTISFGLSPTLLNFGELNWLGIPRLTYILVPVIAVIWYVMEHTPFGRYLQAISSNRRAARLVGIDVQRNVMVSFTLAGLLAGVAGVLLTARSGAADSTTGPSYLFPALAAVMLGVTTIKPGRPNVPGAIVGVFFVAFSVSGLSLIGASSWAPSAFNGAVLIAAAGLAALFSWQRRRGTRSAS